MDKCLPDALMNFMAQYEATRTLSETVLESLPQFFLQIYMVLWCQENTCDFVEEEDASALLQAFTVSVVSITYRFVLTWFEIHAENMTVKQYVGQLVKMGGGLPLAAIAHNDIEEVDINFKLDVAQVRLLAGVLKTNTSVKKLHLGLGLGNCYIGDEGAKELAEALKVNTSLKEISLSSNNIGAEGGKELAEALKELAEALKVNTSLEKIDLRNNTIGDEGAKYVAEALKVTTSLKEIYLWNNNIGDEGAKELAEALKVNT
eukprot:g3124.t1